ncbi:MAG: hypothetical protein EOO61_07850 [Hymenobacter sp.]|nr:MAG: hypothetical protein EOO61_07850 [Hymenobacter sp.]
MIRELRRRLRKVSAVRATHAQVVQPAGHDHYCVTPPLAAQPQCIRHHAQALNATVSVFNYYP